VSVQVGIVRYDRMYEGCSSYLGCKIKEMKKKEKAGWMKCAC
jgi:hypothetical protein